MDPAYISDKPGKSPMGMDLVPVYEDEVMEDAIVIDPVTMQNMGVRSELVRKQKLSRTIRTVGHIDYNEEAIYVINTKIGGYIEKLYVDFTGETVKKGQPLLEIYSPELVNSQEEYISAYTSYLELKDSAIKDVRRGSELLFEATKRRLEYWDISDEQIQELQRTGKARKTMVIHSPANGIVVHKNAIEGVAVKPGQDLFRIADLSSIWLLAHIYEYQLPYLKLGQKATMSLPYFPGEVFNGQVEFIYPYLNEKTRDVKVRLRFPNPGLKLKPQMFADITIESELPGDRLVISEEAVIRTGKREIVFVDADGGMFTPREVITGSSGEGGIIEIKSGLFAGEIIVTSGQFMLDSESKTQEAIKKMIKTRMAAASRKDEVMVIAAAAEITPAQGEGNLSLTPEKKAHSADEVYTCPMDSHSHILRVGPGTCPECNMKLVPITETGRTVYTCPMEEHHHILSDKPGNCPECNMKLVPLGPDSGNLNLTPDKKAHSADEVYTCPMDSHSHILQVGPGTCPECNMKLVPITETSRTVYTCPMEEHHHILSDEPGLCPECNMKLIPMENHSGHKHEYRDGM